MKKFLALILMLFMVIPGISVSAEETAVLNLDNDFTNSDQWIIEEISYDEMIERISESTGESILNLKEQYPNLSMQDGRALTSIGYLSVGRGFSVTSEYRPAMTFYLEVVKNSNGTPTDINKVITASLNRNNTQSNGPSSKQFSGTIFYELLSSKQLYFQVNGDFYNNGTTTVGGGAEIEVGESVTLNFSASVTTSHYKYCWFEDLMVLN